MVEDPSQIVFEMGLDAMLTGNATHGTVTAPPITNELVEMPVPYLPIAKVPPKAEAPHA